MLSIYTDAGMKNGTTHIGVYVEDDNGYPIAERTGYIDVYDLPNIQCGELIALGAGLSWVVAHRPTDFFYLYNDNKPLVEQIKRGDDIFNSDPGASFVRYVQTAYNVLECKLKWASRDLNRRADWLATQADYQQDRWQPSFNTWLKQLINKIGQPININQLFGSCVNSQEPHWIKTLQQQTSADIKAGDVFMLANHVTGQAPGRYHAIGGFDESPISLHYAKLPRYERGVVYTYENVKGADSKTVGQIVEWLPTNKSLPDIDSYMLGPKNNVHRIGRYKFDDPRITYNKLEAASTPI